MNQFKRKMESEQLTRFFRKGQRIQTYKLQHSKTISTKYTLTKPKEFLRSKDHTVITSNTNSRQTTHPLPNIWKNQPYNPHILLQIGFLLTSSGEPSPSFYCLKFSRRARYQSLCRLWCHLLAYMVQNLGKLTNSFPYSGSEKIMIGDGKHLDITNTRSKNLSCNLKLSDVIGYL